MLIIFRGRCCFIEENPFGSPWREYLPLRMFIDEMEQFLSFWIRFVRMETSTPSGIIRVYNKKMNI